MNYGFVEMIRGPSKHQNSGNIATYYLQRKLEPNRQLKRSCSKFSRNVLMLHGKPRSYSVESKADVVIKIT